MILDDNTPMDQMEIVGKVVVYAMDDDVLCPSAIYDDTSLGKVYMKMIKEYGHPTRIDDGIECIKLSYGNGSVWYAALVLDGYS